MVNRRSFLGVAVQAVIGLVAAVVAVIAGGAVLRPPVSRREDWVDAGAVADLSATPSGAAISVDREDGYQTRRGRSVVYLVRDAGGVHAFSATCTHLGCRVSWHEADNAFRCPCHGGRFTRDGTVSAGPPPRGLDRLDTRVEGGRVLVRIA